MSFRLWRQPAKRQEYDFETIDNIVTTLQVDRLDCLKIGVDSFIFDVLRGAQGTLERFNPWIVVKLNHALAKRNQSVNEVLEWLVSRGYESAFITDCENFILHRNTAASSAECSASIHLTFDSRPLFLQSQYVKGKPLAGIIKTECAKLNDAKIEFQQKNGPWRLTAPGPRWSFAASWALSVKKLEGPFLIEIKLRVSCGTIGIVCISRDYSTFKGKEILVEPAQTLQTVTVVVDDISDIGHLIIRNTDIAGAVAHIEVIAFNTFTAEPAAPKQQSALLSLQKKSLAISECEWILRGGEVILSSSSAQGPGIDVVPVEKIHSAFGFHETLRAEDQNLPARPHRLQD